MINWSALKSKEKFGSPTLREIIGENYWNYIKDTSSPEAKLDYYLHARSRLVLGSNAIKLAELLIEVILGNFLVMKNFCNISSYPKLLRARMKLNFTVCKRSSNCFVETKLKMEKYFSKHFVADTKMWANFLMIMFFSIWATFC